MTDRFPTSNERFTATGTLYAEVEMQAMSKSSTKERGQSAGIADEVDRHAEIVAVRPRWQEKGRAGPCLVERKGLTVVNRCLC